MFLLSFWTNLNYPPNYLAIFLTGRKRLLNIKRTNYQCFQVKLIFKEIIVWKSRSSHLMLSKLEYRDVFFVPYVTSILNHFVISSSGFRIHSDNIFSSLSLCLSLCLSLSLFLSLSLSLSLSLTHNMCVWYKHYNACCLFQFHPYMTINLFVSLLATVFWLYQIFSLFLSWAYFVHLLYSIKNLPFLSEQTQRQTDREAQNEFVFSVLTCSRC